VRLLRLEIDEPIPGNVLPTIAASHGKEEAARRYKAIVVTTMRQLRGLTNTRIELLCSPTDAAEAIRFWLLPRLADAWQPQEQAFLSDGWNITFGATSFSPSIQATGHILCPWLCARWVHTAMLGLESGTHQAVGRSPHHEVYFRAQAGHPNNNLTDRILPPLPVIHTDADWNEALDSPLGPALKKAWEAEG